MKTHTTTVPFRRSTHAAAPNSREWGNPANWRFWLQRQKAGHIDEPEQDATFTESGRAQA